jgi:hypothetical protein
MAGGVPVELDWVLWVEILIREIPLHCYLTTWQIRKNLNGTCLNGTDGAHEGENGDASEHPSCHECPSDHDSAHAQELAGVGWVVSMKKLGSGNAMGELGSMSPMMTG